MDEFAAHLRKVQKISFFFLSFCFMAWAVFPAYREYAAGMILGTAVSMINSRYLAWKIRLLSKAALEQSGRKINMGFATRAAMSLLAVLIAYKLEQVAISTTLVGLFFVQLATLLVGIISNLQPRK